MVQVSTTGKESGALGSGHAVVRLDLESVGVGILLYLAYATLGSKLDASLLVKLGETLLHVLVPAIEQQWAAMDLHHSQQQCARPPTRVQIIRPMLLPLTRVRFRMLKREAHKCHVGPEAVEDTREFACDVARSDDGHLAWQLLKLKRFVRGDRVLWQGRVGSR